MATIEYFYAAHSAFAYLGSRRFYEIVATSGSTIIHRPYDLRRGMLGVGSILTRDRTPGHRAYFFGREIERWSEQRDAPIMSRRPTHHDNDITLPNCVLIAAQVLGAARGANTTWIPWHTPSSRPIGATTPTSPTPPPWPHSHAASGSIPSRCWPQQRRTTSSASTTPIPMPRSTARSSARRPMSSMATCSTARTAWKWWNAPCAFPIAPAGPPRRDRAPDLALSLLNRDFPDEWPFHQFLRQDAE